MKSFEVRKEVFGILEYWKKARATAEEKTANLERDYKVHIENDEDATIVSIEGLDSEFMFFGTEYEEELNGNWKELDPPEKVQEAINKYYEIWNEVYDNFKKFMIEKGFTEIIFDEDDEDSFWLSEWYKDEWFFRVPNYSMKEDHIDYWCSNVPLEAQIARRNDTMNRWKKQQEVK